MASLLPLFRLLHFFGLSLFLGGIVCSLVLFVRLKGQPQVGKALWTCTHLVAAPGLLLLLITGIFQSQALSWAVFRGAGYMHFKMLLVALLLGLLVMDIRTQKRMSQGQGAATAAIAQLSKKRQLYGLMAMASTLLIFWLMCFRPF